MITYKDTVCTLDFPVELDCKEWLTIDNDVVRYLYYSTPIEDLHPKARTVLKRLEESSYQKLAEAFMLMNPVEGIDKLAMKNIRKHFYNCTANCMVVEDLVAAIEWRNQYNPRRIVMTDNFLTALRIDLITMFAFYARSLPVVSCPYDKEPPTSVVSSPKTAAACVALIEKLGKDYDLPLYAVLCKKRVGMAYSVIEEFRNCSRKDVHVTPKAMAWLHAAIELLEHK